MGQVLGEVNTLFIHTCTFNSHCHVMKKLKNLDTPQIK